MAATRRDSVVTSTVVMALRFEGSPYLESDAVFGVENPLIHEFTREASGRAPDGTVVAGPWRRLSYDFSLKPARAPALAAVG